MKLVYYGCMLQIESQIDWQQSSRVQLSISWQIEFNLLADCYFVGQCNSTALSAVTAFFLAR